MEGDYVGFIKDTDETKIKEEEEVLKNLSSSTNIPEMHRWLPEGIDDDDDDGFQGTVSSAVSDSASKSGKKRKNEKGGKSEVGLDAKKELSRKAALKEKKREERRIDQEIAEMHARQLETRKILVKDFVLANLQALVMMEDEFGKDLVDEGVVSLVFRTLNDCPLDDPVCARHSLFLLFSVLRQCDFYHRRGRQEGADLRGAVSRWINIQATKPHQLTEWDEKLIFLLNWWGVVFEILEKEDVISPPSAPDSKRDDLSHRYRVGFDEKRSLKVTLFWVFQAHLENDCFGLPLKTLDAVPFLAEALISGDLRIPRDASRIFFQVLEGCALIILPNDVLLSLFPLASELAEYKIDRKKKLVKKERLSGERVMIHCGDFDNRWHLTAIIKVLSKILERLNEESRQQSGAFETPGFLDPGGEVELLSLLRQSPIVWPLFLSFELSREKREEELLQGKGKWKEVPTEIEGEEKQEVREYNYSQHLYDDEGKSEVLRLKRWFGSVSKAFLIAAQSFDVGSCLLDLVLLCTSSLQKTDLLECAWDALELPLTLDILASRKKEISKQAKILSVAISVVQVRMPSSRLAKDLKILQDNWPHFTLNQVRYFFLLEDERPPQSVGLLREVVYRRIPRLFRSALKWLQVLNKSTLFSAIWNEFGDPANANLDRLPIARRAFIDLRQGIDNRSLSFSRLEQIGHFLVDKKEVSFLWATTLRDEEYSPEMEDESHWIVHPVSEEASWIPSTLGLGADWIHVQSVHSSLSDIRKLLAFFDIFIQPSGLESLHLVSASAGKLHNMFSSGKWEDFLLSDAASTFKTHSQHIDPCLCHLDPELFSQISKSLEVLEWLRARPDDKDFQSSLEMALGRTEMECPVELWISDKGGDKSGGRPDESKLSMLRTVRSYLHSLIYRIDDRLPCLQDLLGILRRFPPTDPNVIRSLKTCTEYLLPLMELLDDQSDESAPDRLLQLMLPSRHAIWHCTTAKDDLSLAWEIPRKDTVLERSQNINELTDFQSMVVLARTDQRTPETQAAIDRFVLEFGSMKLLNTLLNSLHTAGHFDFREYSHSSPLTPPQIGDPDVTPIQSEVYSMRAKLQEWNDEVEAERDRSYFFNFFCMKEMWGLVDAMDALTFGFESVTRPLTPETIHNTLKTIIHCVSPFGDEMTFQSSMSDVWHSSPPPLQRTAFDTLHLCGKALQDSLQHVSPLFRPITHLNIGEPDTHGANDQDQSAMLVRLVVAQDKRDVVDYLLSDYAREGYLPERQEVLYCKTNTTWEEVGNFLIRWKFAHLNSRSGRLYCLASVQDLSFPIQRRATVAIRDAVASPSSETKMNSLLIISAVSGGGRSQHLATQLSHFRSTAGSPLAPTLLSLIGKSLACDYSCGCEVHVSKKAGGGKTFNVRRLAGSSCSDYVHVPISSAKSLVSSLIQSTSTLLPQMPGSDEDFSDEYLFGADQITLERKTILHIDLLSTVQIDINPVLFELVFLGSIFDCDTGKHFFWEAENMKICIEIASGQTIQKIRVAHFLPLLEALPSAVNFCSSKGDLQDGMREEFGSFRCDGTAIRKQASGRQPADAYKRLQYVCLALDILDSSGGRFPYVFEGPQLNPLQSLRLSRSCEIGAHNELDHFRCFNLLKKASKLTDDCLSLWCLWNFVNVFYWQLRDMHYPDSPINSACMPDAKADRSDDVEQKGKIKGEVIHFMLNTAREFATRQTILEDPLKITGCYSTGMSRWDFNGYWERQAFDNDSQPVFKSGSFFLYYRKKQDQWVIDDVVEFSGAVFSCSDTGDINGRWTTSPDWKDCTGMYVTYVNWKSGYHGEAMRLSGCRPAENNGTYERLPPYDDIADHPHYMMSKPRRHLFWSVRESFWQVCPVCTSDEGAYAISKTSSISGGWKYMPPDIVEASHRFEFVTKEGEKLLPVVQTQEKAPAKNTQKKRNKQKTKEKDVSEELEELQEQSFKTLMKWNESNHECILFSNETHTVTFLSMNPKEMRRKMHPRLLEHLQENSINVGEDLDELKDRHHQILSSLTEVTRTKQQAENLMSGSYCLTGDSLLKMLAIFVKIRCGVPVVLLGECGCGKTMLLKYLCAWLGVTLFVLDVHGGTTEEDICEIFDKAELELGKKVKKVKRGSGTKGVYIFLDEINTCPHMGLMVEAICHRSIKGKRLSDGIQVLAALNPYRLRKNQAQSGLVYQLHTDEGGVVSDPMSKLVYRVHPIPSTIKDFIFDFGSLTQDHEKLYISAMVHDKLTDISNRHLQVFIAELILASQLFVRTYEEDPSACSLRDVTTCLNLISWFHEKIVPKKTKKKAALSPIAGACVLGLAFTYYFRLDSKEERDNYWQFLGPGGQNTPVLWNLRQLKGLGFDILVKPGSFQRLLKNVQKQFCNNFMIEDGIAMNEALMENLFVVTISILNKIPIFVVGKPGTSKTLTMQVIASNLLGKQSPSKFFHKFPSIYLFQYQCSPMSDSHSIQHQFDMAVRYQKHADDCITVLLLDEVGLAEHSPEMPLKVLHSMLISPPIAIVGLSNWVLDPAKMNRAICLQRPEPSPEDIVLTGQRILDCQMQNTPDQKEQPTQLSTHRLASYLTPLARAYHSIYTKQQGRDFIGMRDYYSLIKLLKERLSQCDLTADLLSLSICRNFGGKPELIVGILEEFALRCFGDKGFAPKELPPVQTLISENLRAPNSRHLMVLTQNGVALPFMFNCRLLDERTTKVLIGSDFKDDRSELHLVKQINEVKIAMATGSTLVLLNHDNIYEALYDVLNQRYLFRQDQLGKVKKMLRLAIGSRSQLCQVQDGFKVVVIVEQQHAYSNLDLPLLNRFEKQAFTSRDLLGKHQWELVDRLQNWASTVLSETGLDNFQDTFCGFHPGTIPSAVLAATNFDDKAALNSSDALFHELTYWFLRVALPVSVMLSKTLNSVSSLQGKPHYFDLHSDYYSVLQNYVLPNPSDCLGSNTVLLTFSPVSHLDSIFKQTPRPLQTTHTVIHLSDLSSESQLVSQLNEFYQEENNSTVLVIQSDPIVGSQSLINHTMHLCSSKRSSRIRELEASGTSPSITKHIVILVHLPPGAKKRLRHFMLDFLHPWSFVFLDDLRPQSLDYPSTKQVLETSCFDLIESGQISLDRVVHTEYQSALASCPFPSSFIEDPSTSSSSFASYRNRINLFKSLLADEDFFSLLKKLILSSLEFHKEPNKHGMHMHVQLVCSDNVRGSLRQSLQLSVHKLVIQAMAHSIRYLDANFNLSLCQNSPDLWFSLASLPTILDPSTLGQLSRLGTGSNDSDEVLNTGRFGPLIAKFPFSHSIIKVLDAPETRESLDYVERIGIQSKEGTGTFIQPQQLNSVCATLFAEKILLLWKEFEGKECLRYLHDFVATTTSPLPSLSNLEEVLPLHEAVIRATWHSALETPAGIHTAHWANEERLFRIKSLFDSPLPSLVKRNLRYVILNFPPSDNDDSFEATSTRMMSMDRSVLASLVDSFWSLVLHFSPSKCSKREWLNGLVVSSSDIEDLMAPFSHDSSPNMTIVKKRWTAIKVFGLMMTEIGLEFEEIFKLVLSGIDPPNKPKKQQDKDRILEWASSANPSSASFFLSLCQSCRSFCCTVAHPIARKCSSFLRRYVAEVCFDFRSPTPPENELLQIFNSIVNNDSYICDSVVCSDNTIFSMIDLPLSRTLLLGLQKYHTFRASSLGSALLQLQLISDTFSETVSNKLTPKESDRLAIVFGNNVNKAEADDSDENSLLFDDLTLRSIAKTQLHCRDYSFQISRPHFEKEKEKNKEEAKYLLPPDLDPFVHCACVRAYLLKSIKANGGLSCLVGVVSHPSAQWARSCAEENDDKNIVWSSSSIPDPFCWLLPRRYKELSSAVMTCLTSAGNTSRLEKLLKNANPSDTAALLGATFRQIALDDEFCNPKGIIHFFSFFHRLVNNTEVSHLLPWLQRGCFLPSCMKNHDFSKYALQASFHVALVAVKRRSGWLRDLLFTPGKLSTQFLPAIQDTDVLTSAARLFGFMGWYTCPKGHPYSVGQCTYPMETARCIHPGCGAIIGGRNHQSVTGVGRISDKYLRSGDRAGYFLENDDDGCDRMSRISTIFLRFIIHSLLFYSLQLENSNGSFTTRKFVASLLFPKDINKQRPGEAEKMVCRRVANEWARLVSLTRLEEGRLAIAVHLILSTIDTDLVFLQLIEAKVIDSTRFRGQIEAHFQSTVDRFFGKRDRMQTSIDSALSELGESARVAKMRQFFGESLWAEMTETSDSPSPRQLLWSYCEPVNFDHFVKSFETDSSNIRTYPLLAAFLQEEEKLPVIKYLASILAWQSILFDVLGNNCISREEAAEISNMQAIEMLPSDKRKAALSILMEFCQGFNLGLPMLENLYECQANPFIDKCGEVDLSGTKVEGVKMGPETTIKFSLPSMLQGENDATGLCTIGLLNMMHTTHQRVLAKFNAIQNSDSTTTPLKQMPGASVPAVQPEADTKPDVPPISYLTPAKAMQKQLVSYDRDTDFLPLLRVFNSASLKYGEFGSVDYDFQSIEDAIANGFLAGIRPINLQIRHFYYRGDLRKTGKLTGLRSRIPQEEIISSVEDAISTEVDTQHRVTKLMAYLEMIVNFLVSVGSASVKGIDGDTLLAEFALNVLYIDPSDWDEVATPSINQRIHLKHLQSLFMTLEEHMHGSPLDNVSTAYKEPLEDPLEATLRSVMHHLDVPLLLPVIRDFMTEQLTKDTWPGAESLKEYLTYASGPVDLEELDWYQTYFPDDLQLRHTWNTFQLLSQNKN